MLRTFKLILFLLSRAPPLTLASHLGSSIRTLSRAYMKLLLQRLSAHANFPIRTFIRASVAQAPSSSTKSFETVRAMSAKKVIKGVVFDMDGTLTQSAKLDFVEMRRRCGCETPDILGEVDSWPEERRTKAYEIIGEMEREALKTTTLMAGASAVAETLDAIGIPRALVTRNASSSVDVFHSSIWSLTPFEPALSREFKPYKPAPDALLHICKLWGCDPGEVIMVGDSAKDDVVSGNRAGAITVLLDSGRTKAWAEDFGVDELPEEMVPHFVCDNMHDFVTLLKSEMHFDFHAPPNKVVKAA